MGLIGQRGVQGARGEEEMLQNMQLKHFN